MKNAARHVPNASAMAPTEKNASTKPMGKLNCGRPVARARRSDRYRSATSELTAGAKLASPTPSNNRTTTKAAKPPATPVAALSSPISASDRKNSSLSGLTTIAGIVRS